MAFARSAVILGQLAAVALAARNPQTTAVGTSYSFDGTSDGTSYYGPQRRRRLEEELCGVEQVPCEADYGSNYTIYGTALRRVLLDGYDKVMPPSSVRTGEHNYSKAGSVIYIQTRFFKVKEINAAEGQMRLKVWFRLTWTDERLAWNPDDYGGGSTLQCEGRAAGARNRVRHAAAHATARHGAG
mgnify:CR=1 FL=1